MQFVQFWAEDQKLALVLISAFFCFIDLPNFVLLKQDMMMSLTMRGSTYQYQHFAYVHITVSSFNISLFCSSVFYGTRSIWRKVQYQSGYLECWVRRNPDGDRKSAVERSWFDQSSLFVPTHLQIVWITTNVDQWKRISVWDTRWSCQNGRV